MGVFRFAAVLVIGLSLVSGLGFSQPVSPPGAAGAQGAPSDLIAGKSKAFGGPAEATPAPDQPAPPAAKGEFQGPAACRSDAPKQLPAANFKFRVIIDEYTPWRPALGDVKFAVKGSDFTPGNVDIVACMRWRGSNQPWTQSPSLRLADSTDVNTSTFVATVPASFPSPPDNLLLRMSARRPEDSSALGIVPLADFRIVAKTRDGSGWSYLDVTQPVGITTAAFSAMFATSLVIVAWFALYTMGRLRKVPGSGDVVLQIISTKAGYASLSQLQMIIWTFVIGWAAAYVMALSGSLIELSSGTLVLLGISGVSTLGAKLQGQTDVTITTKPTDRAGPAQALNAQPIEDTEMRLTWSPADAGTTDSYTIAYTDAPVAASPVWTVVAAGYTGTSVRIVGLSAGKSYTFQVTSKNATGVADAACTIKATGAAKTGLGPVMTFGPTDKVANTSAEVAWEPVAGANAYHVQYRHHGSDDDWRDAPSGLRSTIATPLDANTQYDFRIAASPTEALLSLGPWTYALLTTGGPRAPVWSDLIIGLDGKNEIDVARVQMLFFTVILAIFVVLRVITSGTIPGIPDGFLILVGISNGVYLGAKFIKS